MSFNLFMSSFRQSFLIAVSDSVQLSDSTNAEVDSKEDGI